MARVLYPGSFDPFHNGHRELVETAAGVFDEVVVAALRNPQKDTAVFPLEERAEMIREVVAHLDNVVVRHHSGLVVDLASAEQVDLIVKGLRTITDFESEMAQAQMNLSLSGIHTVFLPSTSANSFLSSAFIREVAGLGGDVSSMVPLPVAKRLVERFSR